MNNKSTIQREHPLHRAFVRRPYVTGFAVTLASFLFTGGIRALVTSLLFDGPHVAAVAAGIQQSLLAIVVLVLLWRMGWLRSACVWSRAHRPASWWPCLILPAALIPLAALFDVDWTKTAAIAASIFDYTTTGLVEEFVFRGLVLAGLIVGLEGKPHATFKAVIASSFLFGLPHLSPIGIVFATVFGLSFAALTLSTNTIWIAVVVHIAFDLFTDLPNATNGISGRWYVFVPVLFVLASGIVTIIRARNGALPEQPSGFNDIGYQR
jgi:membrane protease YdiL (CAAX protease family)